MFLYRNAFLLFLCYCMLFIKTYHMRKFHYLIFTMIVICFTYNTNLIAQDVVRDNMDLTVKPSFDFFQYANGGWIKKNKIPNEESEWGIGNLVINENLGRLRQINQNAAKKTAPKGSSTQQIGDFWATAMDSNKIEKINLIPFQPYLNYINSIKDISSLISCVATLNNIGVTGIFNYGIGQDDKNSEVIAYKLRQGGIGLPEREYYFKTDPTTLHIREAYVNYITNILVMQGQHLKESVQSAKNILYLETEFAKHSRKLEELRDPYKNYNKVAIKDLSKLTKTIDWKNYLANTGVKNIDSVIVGQPEFFKSLDTLLSTTSFIDWKNYLRFRLLRTFSSALPDKYGEATFNFTKLLNGAKERKPRWKRVIQTEEGEMGELLGQLYVKEYFGEVAKKRYNDLVEAIRSAYKQRIEKLTWMSDSTKLKALEKLQAIKKKVGYPDKWKDFSAMEIGRESYLQNLINANKWWHKFEMKKLGNPVDRDEWEMFPQTYNAYYNPSNNEIVLPAGIFTVPGFKDADIDDAVVYGYAGASTIGHEITHGFDDEGRLYDKEGNLRNWWTTKDSTEFSNRSIFMVNQFNEFEPVPGIKINGKATLGENIADLGGILLGIDAFKKTEEFKKNEIKAGLTPMQRFFMGYALGWLGQIREESLRNRLMTDVHAPAKYRVNGPFMNVEEFYSTFGIKKGDEMFRDEYLRVNIW